MLEAATHHWGRDVAVTLMEMLPPSGWGDVATRQQVDALRDEMHREFAVVRDEMHRENALIRAEARADLADAQRRILQWTVGTVIAMSSLSTAVIAVLVR